MNTAKGLCCTFALALGLVAQAGEMKQDAQWYASIGLGIGDGHSGHTDDSINNGRDFPGTASLDGYHVDHFAKSPTLLAEAGRRFQRASSFIPAYSLGLRYQHHFSRSLSGTVTEMMLPEFINYRFNISSVSDELRLNGKLNLIDLNTFQPYVSAGIGASHHQTRSYNESALADVTPRFSPDFADNSQTTLSYALGAGIDWLPGNNVIISLGYEFQQLGQVKTGQGTNDWTSQHLDFSNLYSNTVFVQFGCLLD